MSDIVERLRPPASVFYEYSADNGALLEQAADEIEKLRDAINAALTEKTPMEGGLWSQEPIGPNETPAEAIKRLIKFRVDTGCIVERDAFKDEIEKLRAALREIEYLDRPQVRGLPRRVTIQEIARAALGEKE